MCVPKYRLDKKEHVDILQYKVNQLSGRDNFMPQTTFEESRLPIELKEKHVDNMAEGVDVYFL